VLRGSPYTVVGTTNQVSGQIALDGSDPRDVQVGTILVDARTLATDDSSRNRALGNQILSTSEYEYISFTPTQFTGLPDSVTTGQPFTFRATGDLTIRGVTKPATFDVTVTPWVDGRLDGSAMTTIQYADWGVSIPNVPFVASVDKDVQLAFDFTAIAAA
jgi:polyisoprenoid-binding protein YceI